MSVRMNEELKVPEKVFISLNGDPTQLLGKGDDPVSVQLFNRSITPPRVIKIAYEIRPATDCKRSGWIRNAVNPT
jgi:hypothetical protein